MFSPPLFKETRTLEAGTAVRVAALPIVLGVGAAGRVGELPRRAPRRQASPGITPTAESNIADHHPVSTPWVAQPCLSSPSPRIHIADYRLAALASPPETPCRALASCRLRWRLQNVMSVLLETSLGDIVIDLLVDASPKACEK